jgi:predicted outer membrane protein
LDSPKRLWKCTRLRGDAQLEQKGELHSLLKSRRVSQRRRKFPNISGGIAMKKLIAFSVLAMAVCGQALAQSAAQTQERPAAGQPATVRQGQQEYDAQRTTTTNSQGQGNKLDQHLAACLTLGNQEEIALAQFAQEKAQNPQVKQFAQMMIEEHQQAVSKLQQAVPQLASLNLQLKGAQGAGARSASGERAAATAATRGTATDQTASATSGTQRGAAPAQGDQQMLELGRAIKEECLALTQAELGRKQGADFDKCYMAQQVGAHIAMLAELKAGQRFASNQLKPILQEGTQMTEHHLAQARTITEQLEAAGGADAPQNAQRPATGTQPPRR